MPDLSLPLGALRCFRLEHVAFGIDVAWQLLLWLRFNEPASEVVYLGTVGLLVHLDIICIFLPGLVLVRHSHTGPPRIKHLWSPWS